MGFNITDILGSSVLESVKGIIEEFHTSPEAKAALQLQMDQNAQAFAKAQLDYDAKLQDVASQNIQAEAKTGDKYTSRARPSFIYVMLGIIVANYVIFPLIKMPPLQLPDALFWLFGSCMLGYTGARSWDKYAVIQSQAK